MEIVKSKNFYNIFWKKSYSKNKKEKLKSNFILINNKIKK